MNDWKATLQQLKHTQEIEKGDVTDEDGYIKMNQVRAGMQVLTNENSPLGENVKLCLLSYDTADITARDSGFVCHVRNSVNNEIFECENTELKHVS